MKQMFDDDNKELLSSVIGSLMATFISAWLLSLCAAWLFPMIVLPFWKWFVIAFTIKSIA